MNTCPVCGHQVWNYSPDAVICDFGHMHDRNGSRLQFDKVTIAEARPPGVVPHEAVVVKGARWRVLPVAVAAGAVGAGVVELVGRVLA